MGRKKINANNKTTRIGETFNDELEEIKDVRIETGIDSKRRSTRELTELIIKHNSWEQIKDDLIKVNLEKGGDE